MIMALGFASRLLPIGFLLAVAGGAGVAAQTQPTPELPSPEPAPSPDATQAATAAPAASPWDYSLGLGLGWESNVGLDTGQGPSDYTGRIRGNLGYAVRRPKGDVRIAASGTGFFYAEQTQFNRADGSISADIKRDLSQNTSGNLELAASYSHSDSTGILIDQGLLLPLTRTISYSGGMGLTHQASPLTSIRGALRVYRVEFPDSDPLRDSNSYRMSLTGDRRLDERNTLSLVSAAERAGVVGGAVDSTSGAYWTYYLSTQWSHVFSRRTATLLEAGTSYTPDGETAGLGRTWSFYGGASLSRAVKRSRLAAFYRREVVPVFGIGGLSIADRVGLSASVPFARVWEASLGTSYAREAANPATGERLSAFDTVAAVGARVSRQLRLSCEGRYLRRSSFGPYPNTDALRAGVFITLVPPSGDGGRQ